MKLQEHVALAPLTTFGVGGKARFFIEADTEKDIEDALTFARKQNLPIYILGGGSNVLVPDAGISGVVLKMAMRDITVREDGDTVLIIAGAGAPWDEVVDMAGGLGIFGIENLAGIPGTVGGAAVQNIGAYGAELSSVFAYADAVDSAVHLHKRVMHADAGLAYRTSFFKEHPEIVISRVALRLQKRAKPNLEYADVARARIIDTPLSTPSEIASAIRAIRAKKFPHAPHEGTAGSFFKNPVVSRELAAALERRFPGLPTFPQENGSIKIPLAWLLDHALSLKGHAQGLVRLYEEQPLVIVAREGATAAEVNVFACDIAERVLKATGITIEREVETFGEKFFV